MNTFNNPFKNTLTPLLNPKQLRIEKKINFLSFKAKQLCNKSTWSFNDTMDYDSIVREINRLKKQ